MGAPPPGQARFLDRDWRGRQRHGLHRQGRTRPGHFHGANPVGGRRTLRALRPRESHLLRHVDDAGSGRHLRQPVASRPISITAIWRRPPRRRAQALLKLASSASGRPGRSTRGREWRDQPSSDDPSKKVGYGELLGGRSSRFRSIPKPSGSPRASGPCSAHRRSVPDLPALVTGQFEFVHNVRLPGMLHGRVVRPPAVGATVVGVDESSVAGLPGVVKVVVKKNFVGVVAEKPWQAIQAANKLKVTWTPGAGLPNHADLLRLLAQSESRRATRCWSIPRTWTRSSAEAATVVKATYYHPYQMHGSMGSSCAVADVQGDKATIYSPTQGVWQQRGQRCDAARAETGKCARDFSPRLGLLRIERRRHGDLRRGAAFAGRGQAGERAAHAERRNGLGRKLRIRVRHGRARRARRRRQHRRVGSRGVVARAGQSPGLQHAGKCRQRHAGGLSNPSPSSPDRPRPSREIISNNSNGVPSYCAGNVGGAPKGTGTIKSERALIHNVASPFFTGPLRSPARLQNTFAHECFMDELASRVKADPVEYRLRHLSDARLSDVVKAAAKGRELGCAAVAQSRELRRPASPPAAASPAWPTRATTDSRRWSPRSKSIGTAEKSA